MTTAAELLTAKTRDQILTDLLAVLAAEGLPVTSWQAGAVPRSLLKADATALADLYLSVRAVGAAAFLDSAEGAWLTLLASSKFQVPRIPSTWTAGYVQLAVASGLGPYAVSPGGLVVTDGVRRWRSTNTAAVSVTSSAPVSIPVRAESPGAAYNVATGTVINAIVSPAYAGLSVSNPAWSGGTWITAAGADDESDASLRQRCRDRWGTLGRGGTGENSYRYWARTGHAYEAQVTRVQVIAGGGDGTLTVYLAGPSGAVSSPVASAVQAWVNKNKPRTDAALVQSSSAVVVQVYGTVTVSAGSDSTANRARATDAIAAYFAGLDIGADVDLGAIYAAIYQAAGVIDADLSAPTGDVTINNGEVATTTVSLTWVPV